MVRTTVTFLIGVVLGAAGLFLYLQSSGHLQMAVPAVTAARVEDSELSSRRVTAQSPQSTPTRETPRASGEPADDVEDPAEVQEQLEAKPLTTPQPGAALVSSAPIAIPVAGVEKRALTDQFNDSRGSRVHQAIDLMAPRNTPVIAAVSGKIRKLFLSVAGGITIYQYDENEQLVYYYAHLERYAPDIAEGKFVRQGEVIGYVGTSGNANPSGPHLHFSIGNLTATKQWWKTVPVNPYPILMERGVTYSVSR